MNFEVPRTKEQKDAILAEYQVVVHYPKLAGKHVLLNWWSHDEQNHFILAKTFPALELAFKRTLQRRDWCDAKPMALWEIEIVSLPTKIAVQAAQYRRQRDFHAFTGWVADQALASWNKANKGKLPPGFSRCLKYKSTEPGKKKSIGGSHYDCQNCYYGYCYDAEKLYAEKRKKWRQLNRTMFWQAERLSPRQYVRSAPEVLSPDIAGDHNPKYSPSQAPEADILRDLFKVRVSHGPHQDGTILEKVNRTDEAFGDDIKFFCHADLLAADHPVMATLKSMRAQLDAEWKQERERQNAAAEIERTKIAQFYNDTFRSFFE